MAIGMRLSVKSWLFPLLFLLSIGTCLSADTLPTGERGAQTQLKQDRIVYSRSELEAIFKRLKEQSFTDIRKNTALAFKGMEVLGYASPFSLNVFIDVDRLNEYQWPEKAVIGLFAHELSHMVSYERRSFIGRMLFVWDYRFSEKSKRNVEYEADLIAIERGYGEELVLTRTLALRDYDRARVEKMKSTYLSPNALEEIIAKTK